MSPAVTGAVDIIESSSLRLQLFYKEALAIAPSCCACCHKKMINQLTYALGRHPAQLPRHTYIMASQQGEEELQRAAQALQHSLQLAEAADTPQHSYPALITPPAERAAEGQRASLPTEGDDGLQKQLSFSLAYNESSKVRQCAGLNQLFR